MYLAPGPRQPGARTAVGHSLPATEAVGQGPPGARQGLGLGWVSCALLTTSVNEDTVCALPPGRCSTSFATRAPTTPRRRSTGRSPLNGRGGPRHRRRAPRPRRRGGSGARRRGGQRSLRISRSNSANTATMPAIARPVGVVRSKASVRDAKPTPSSWSSFSVNTQRQHEVGEGAAPPIEPPHEHDVDLATTRRELERRGLHLLHRVHDAPPATPGVLPELSDLHRDRLLVRGRHSSVNADVEGPVPLAKTLPSCTVKYAAFFGGPRCAFGMAETFRLWPGDCASVKLSRTMRTADEPSLRGLR